MSTTSKLDFIGFYHEYDEYGCFSNWYHAEFDYAGQHYLNSEQFMMFQKVALFHRYDLADQIMKTDDPAKCKKIAGQPFPEYNGETWSKVKYKLVKQGIKAKFAQNEDILKVLLDTGTALLAECAPRDTEWGIGIGLNNPKHKDVSKWLGKNYLGRALMEVREELRAELRDSGDGKLVYRDAREREPIAEWNMTAGELKRIPQYYEVIHTYSDTLSKANALKSFYNGCSLYKWEIAMRTNMGGGLPIAGFFEMKQEVYEIAERLNPAVPPQEHA